jgi:F-type H+-transporting ATPase subunit delta
MRTGAVRAKTPKGDGCAGLTDKRERNVAQSGSIVAGVGGRYASALFELAQEMKVADAVGTALDQFGAMIDASEDLQKLVRSPVFSADEQVGAVNAVLKTAKIDGIAANFIGLVASKRRLFALPSMIAAYRQLNADAKGIVRAEVTLAEQPSAAQLKDIAAALKDAAGKQVTIDLRIDPSLIGGLVVKMGSKMVDASLKTKLNSLRIAMKEVG